MSYLRQAIVCALVTGSLLPAQADLYGSLIDQAGVTVPLRRLDYRLIAPIVVLGRVESNRPVGQPKSAERAPGLMLQMRTVKLALEAVLRAKSEPSPHPAEFDYYAVVDPNAPRSFHKTLFEAVEGRRYIFFLYREGKKLRSIGDAGPYSIPVHSGEHTEYGGLPPEEKHFGERFATILLRPGARLDEVEFSANLWWDHGVATQIARRPVTRRLLRELVGRPEAQIRKAACFELAKRYPGQSKCLGELLAGTSLSPAERGAFEKLAEAAPKEDERLLTVLRDPARLADLRGASSEPYETLLDELLLMVDHPNAGIRDAACRSVTRYFPYREGIPECGSK